MGNVVSVDMNAGHLAVAVLDPDGNQIGVPRTIGLPLAGLPATTRDGHLRAAISDIPGTAREHHATADRERGLRRRPPPRPRTHREPAIERTPGTCLPTPGNRYPHCQISGTGSPTWPATPAWPSSPWTRPAPPAGQRSTGSPPCGNATPGSPASTRQRSWIGRRGLGLRARRRAPGNLPAPEDAARSTQARHGTEPKAGTQPGDPPPRWTPGSLGRHQDRKAPTDHGRRPGDPRPFGAARHAGLAPAR